MYIREKRLSLNFLKDKRFSYTKKEATMSPFVVIVPYQMFLRLFLRLFLHHLLLVVVLYLAHH